MKIFFCCTVAIKTFSSTKTFQKFENGFIMNYITIIIINKWFYYIFNLWWTLVISKKKNFLDPLIFVVKNFKHLLISIPKCEDLNSISKPKLILGLELAIAQPNPKTIYSFILVECLFVRALTKLDNYLLFFCM